MGSYSGGERETPGDPLGPSGSLCEGQDVAG